MEQCEEIRSESSTCLNMTLSGTLTLQNVPLELATALKKKIRLPNQSYQQAIRRNPRARYSLSPFIPYYEETRTGETCELVAPRGLRESVRQYLIDRDIQFTFEDRTVSQGADITDTIELRDYQQGVPEQIIGSTCGVVRADTGSGKSILALRIASLLKQKTLIIVPKLNLLTQFVYDIKQFTGLDAGTIQGNNFDIKDITVATIQTLAKRIGEDRLTGDEFGCVIVDECHESISEIRRKAIGRFASRFLYGLTATSRRTDGQDKAINWIYGQQLCDLKLPRATPTVDIVEFKGRIPVEEYPDMIQNQIENEERNLLIVSLAEREIQRGRKILILTKRVAHYELLKEQIKADNVFAISSRGKKEERATLLRGLKEGTQDFDCLLGTFSLLGTGIDIPLLDLLIIAGDLKSDVLAEQSAGRVLRLLSGKADPRIIDIRDTGNPILRNQGRLREGFYKEQGWTTLLT